MLKWIIGAACFIAFSGCAGRAPQLTPVVQATDQHIACDQIQAEAKINNDRITALAKEQGWKVGQNVAAGVIGQVIWPVWFGMDFQDAAGKEAQSISQRNEYLMTLAKTRCGAPSETASITRNQAPQY